MSVTLFAASSLWQPEIAGTTINRVENPTVAIVAYITSSAQLQVLNQCLHSVAAQTHGHRLLLIDNASPAGFAEELQGLGAVRRKSNNLGAARDQAVRLAQTEFIAFVDCDVILPAQWLETLMSSIGESVGAATQLTPDSQSTFGAALSLALANPIVHLSTPQAHSSAKAIRPRHLATAAVLFRRQAIVDAGGFDSRFSRVCEDLEMSVRLNHRFPLSLLLLPEPKVVHRQDDSAMAWFRRVFRYGWGQVEVMRVHPRFALGLKALPFLLGLVVLVIVGVAATQGEVGLILGAAFGVQYICITIGLVLGAAIARGDTDPRSLRLTPYAWFLMTGTHWAYTIGEWAGVLGLRRNPSVKDDGAS